MQTFLTGLQTEMIQRQYPTDAVRKRQGDLRRTWAAHLLSFGYMIVQVSFSEIAKTSL